MLAPKSITRNSLSSVNSGKSVKHVSVICQTGGCYGRCIVGPYVSERRFLSPADTLSKLRVRRQLNSLGIKTEGEREKQTNDETIQMVRKKKYI